MTYVTICLLLMLGDDLTRLKKVDIIRGLTPLQRSDGRFTPHTLFNLAVVLRHFGQV